MVAFDRATPWCGKSLALVAFRWQFTELNDQYWAPMPAELFIKQLESQQGASTRLTDALGVSGSDWHRVGHNVASVSSKFKVSRRWARLLTLVLLTSSTEAYFRNITRAANLSDPTRVPGFPKSPDGLSHVKRGIEMDFDPNGAAQGEWSKRISYYRTKFGSVPKVLADSESELEKMRKTRNRVAHEFGLDGGGHPYGFLSNAKPSSISPALLKKWLGLVDDVAKAVDAHLVSEFVGDFETLELLHLWKSGERQLMASTGVTMAPKELAGARPFMKFLAKATKRSVNGKQYYQGLEEFYSSV